MITGTGESEPIMMEDQEQSILTERDLPLFSQRPNTNQKGRRKRQTQSLINRNPFTKSCLLRPSTQMSLRGTSHDNSVLQIEEETSKDRYTCSGVQFYKAEESMMSKRTNRSV